MGIDKVDIVLEKAAATPHTFPTSQTYLGPFEFTNKYNYWCLHVDYLDGAASHYFDKLYIYMYWSHKAHGQRRKIANDVNDGDVVVGDVVDGWTLTGTGGDQFNIVLGAQKFFGNAAGDIVPVFPRHKNGNYLEIGYYVNVGAGTPVASYLNMYLYKWS